MDAAASKFNPLVILHLGLLGVITVSLSANLREALLVLVIFAMIAKLLGLQPREGLADARLMLPWAVVFYGIHIFFTATLQESHSLIQTAADESVILGRLIGLTFALGTIRRGIVAQRLIDSLKTAVDAIHLHSRWIEDILQGISLTLAFIPHVQNEYASLRRFHQALGFKPPKTWKERAGYYAGHLVPVLSRSLDRARQVGWVMEFRAYGSVIPRGQLTPVYFRLSDFMVVSAVTMLLGGALWVM